MFVRPSFDPDVKALFPTEANQNICHVLSWQYMNTVMGNLIQELPETEEEMQKWTESFEYFVCSICLPDDNFEEVIPNLASEEMIPRFLTVAQGIRNAVIEHKSQIIGIVTNYVEMVQQADDENIFAALGNIYDTIVEQSWELLERMNSMPTNLKIGNASWNKSIGGAVDPRAWGFSIAEQPTMMLTEQGFQNISVPTFSPSEVEVIEEVSGLYCELTHPVDHIQLTYAFNIDSKFVVPATYLYTGIYETQEQGLILTVCSSSNPLLMINSDMNHQSIPVYVKHLTLNSQNDYQWVSRY
ncbi:hypothetical protein [Leuconostoc falkenbergense]|uniref:hypothetical protein n=1 Tax=Leuconostoc falkenbergense TaxID=2766470 RepID=UPI0024A89761|nr:hypothetical protein [Leuconostoc falkenbergense]MDI6552917.1 hypothetical protein [Leuconostoc falkenbergense]